MKRIRYLAIDELFLRERFRVIEKEEQEDGELILDKSLRICILIEYSISDFIFHLNQFFINIIF